MLAFDPSDLPSGTACVGFLKENGISISQKIGAMLIWLAKRGVQISLAALEDCSIGSEQEQFLLSLKHIEKEDGNLDRNLLIEKTKKAGFSYCIESGIFKVISEYEEPEEAEPQIQSSFLPTTRQEASMLISQKSITANSVLNDRKYIEELAFDFLDSDDEEIVCTNMKKLARISMMSGQSPENIYISAFKKNSKNIWLKTAEMIAEMNDREFGDTLSIFINDSENREKTAAACAMQCLSKMDGFRSKIFLSLLPRIMIEMGQTSIVTSNRRIMMKLFSSYPQYINEIISSLPLVSKKAEPADMKILRAFISSLNSIYPVWQIIDNEISLSAMEEDRIYLIWILSAIKELPDESKLKYSSIASEMMRGTSKSVYIAEMIKTILKNFQPFSIEDIEKLSFFYKEMSDEMKECSFSLWEEVYGQNPPNSIKEIIRNIFNSGSESDIQRALSSHMIQGCLPFMTSKSDEVVKIASYIYLSDRSGDIKKRLPKLLSEIVEDPCEIFINSLSNRKANDICEDDIDFLSSLFMNSSKNTKDDSLRIIKCLKSIDGKLSLHAMKNEARVLLHANITDQEEELSRLLNTALDESIPLSSRLEIIFPIVGLIENDKAEDALKTLSKETEKATESDKSIFIDMTLEMFKNSPKLRGYESILSMFMRKNAIRMTMPSLDMKMRMSEELLKNNSYMSRYEEETWSWENCGQSLFAASALISRKDCPEKAFKKSSDLISYCLRHWSLAERGFFIRDSIIFRVMLESLNACEIRKTSDSDKLKEVIKESIENYRDRQKISEFSENEDFIKISKMLQK